MDHPSREDVRARMRLMERADAGVREHGRKRMMASGSTDQIASVCMHCHTGLTHSDDVLIALNPDAKRSHGICPDCEAEHYPEEGDET